MNLAACLMGTGRYEPFSSMGLFENYKDVNPKDVAGSIDKDDCLVVWGGSDISPSLYGKRVSERTGAGEEPSYRDAYEWAAMQRAKELGIPIIGVCRGAQMLCALAGGHLIQDVENHGSGHTVVTIDGREFRVNSLHHQMMYPWNVEHELIAWTKEKRSFDRHGTPVYIDEDINLEDVPCEPEMVYFPKVRGIAIQWHPEFMNNEAEATDYIAQFLKEKVL